MKRTSFVLASLLTIALSSCSSNDSLNSSAEDLSYQQTPALKKVIPIDEEQSPYFEESIQGLTKLSPATDIQSDVTATPTSTRGCSSVNGTPYSMSVINVPYNTSRQVMSNWVYFNFNSSSSWATSHQFIASTSSGAGTFSVDYMRIECGEWGGNFTSLSYMNISTTAFAGLVRANETCRLAFVGRCVGTAVGGGPCSLSYSNWKGTVCY